MFIRVLMVYPFVCDVAVYRLAQVVVDVKLWLVQVIGMLRYGEETGAPCMGRQRAGTDDVNQVEN